MIDIRPLEQIGREDLTRLIVGYTAHERYNVSRVESDASTVFKLELVRLEVPFIKPPDVIDEAALQFYETMVAEGLSLGVYEGEQLIAMALASLHSWNHSLYVYEFRVAEGYRGRGIGRALMEAVIERNRDAGVRIVVCETQNTNVPAIRFYRKAGFTLDGIDLSLYTNDAGLEGEIALFMKRKV